MKKFILIFFIFISIFLFLANLKQCNDINNIDSFYETIIVNQDSVIKCYRSENDSIMCASYRAKLWVDSIKNKNCKK